MRIKFISFIIIVSVLFVSFFTSQKNPQWKGKIEYEDGIEVIKNPKQPMYGEDVFSIDEDLSIGVAEGKNEYVFFHLSYLAVDDQETIYAMDQGEKLVKVYDKKGNFLRTIGKKGEGPGELQNPDDIFIINTNNLVIEDFIRNISYFSTAGKYIRSLSTSKIFPIGVILNSQGYILSITNINAPNKWGKEISLYDENLRYLKTIISIPQPKPNPQILKPFQPKINMSSYKDDYFIVSFKEEYELQIFNPKGELVKKIIQEYKPIKVTEEDVKISVGQVSKERKLVVPSYFPAIYSFTTDDEGRIFVHTYEKDGNGKRFIDVFDQEGRYIAKIPLKDHPKVWKNGKLYTIEEDIDSFHVIKRYKVTWNY